MSKRNVIQQVVKRSLAISLYLIWSDFFYFLFTKKSQESNTLLVVIFIFRAIVQWYSLKFLSRLSSFHPFLVVILHVAAYTLSKCHIQVATSLNTIWWTQAIGRRDRWCFLSRVLLVISSSLPITLIRNTLAEWKEKVRGTNCLSEKSVSHSISGHVLRYGNL